MFDPNDIPTKEESKKKLIFKIDSSLRYSFVLNDIIIGIIGE